MKKMEFSKFLLVQESLLIWIITIALVVLAFFCIFNEFLGELPWITTMVALPWTAYGVSQSFYYNKAKAENVLKIGKNTIEEEKKEKEEEFTIQEDM